MSKKREAVHDTEGQRWFCKCGAALNVFQNCPFEGEPLPVKHPPLRNPKPKKERKP